MVGLGVMIGLLDGNKDSVETFNQSTGKTIAALEIVENELIFTFDNDSKMKLFDDGQSCCETRYMHTDDNLQDFIGSMLQGAEVREGAEETSEWGESKESEFLIVSTSKGQFTIVNYNEHNGYYGGFLIVAAKV